MFAIAARRMGYRVHTFSPDSDTPTGQVADVEIKAPYSDLDAVRRFARNVSVVTFEFENVPAATASAAAECCPVRPAGEILHTTQHRLREKTFLQRAGLPVTPFRHVTSFAELESAVAALGLPAILKTADFGYDGKGQFRLTARAILPRRGRAWVNAKRYWRLSFASSSNCRWSRRARGRAISFTMARSRISMSTAFWM